MLASPSDMLVAIRVVKLSHLHARATTHDIDCAELISARVRLSLGCATSGSDVNTYAFTGLMFSHSNCVCNCFVPFVCLCACVCVPPADKLMDRTSATASMFDVHSHSKGLTVVDEAMNASQISRHARSSRALSADPDSLRAVAAHASAQKAALEENLKV